MHVVTREYVRYKTNHYITWNMKQVLSGVFDCTLTDVGNYINAIIMYTKLFLYYCKVNQYDFVMVQLMAY